MSTCICVSHFLRFWPLFWESVQERLRVFNATARKVAMMMMMCRRHNTYWEVFVFIYWLCIFPPSLSARSEHLEYPCANFVQTPVDSKRTSSVLCCNDLDIDLEKMTIKCHYNPIMDEYLRWPTKSKDAIFSKTKFILPA